MFQSVLYIRVAGVSIGIKVAGVLIGIRVTGASIGIRVTGVSVSITAHSEVRSSSQHLDHIVCITIGKDFCGKGQSGDMKFHTPIQYTSQMYWESSVHT